MSADVKILNKLTPAQVSVMRHKTMEAPYYGKYWDFFGEGTYACAACSTELFASADKIDTKTGWPSFQSPIDIATLEFKGASKDNKTAEVRCKRCKCFLGEVIAADVPYYRINSVCLTFTPIMTLSESQSVAPPTAPSPEVPADLPEVENDDALQSFLSRISPLTRGLLAGLIVGTLVTTYAFSSPADPTALMPTSTTTPETAAASDITTTPSRPQTPVEPEQVEDTQPIDIATSSVE